ncbi:ribosomal RNA small subunit methyltransferase E [Fulvitalea axinellae]|uniref:Ribosomal RNA small subunit methyltransferase E n=1 Tax=Fulvitalea axinellae TaxID=1182444 RepID=A0AAU9CLW0_9BACT|nr:ribosomal RNA small subunit methyltransferase E [Fulvitalea axinellae]
MILFYQPDITNKEGLLSPEESLHCVKVLRKQVGDHIFVTNGKGELFDAEITKADKRKCLFKVTNRTEKEKTWNGKIAIAIAPTKNLDRIEWFTEKSVEIGVDEISFLLCHHSERKHFKLDRIEKKAISAMKQSLKFEKPKLNDLTKFKEFITTLSSEYDERFIAYVDRKNPHTLKASHVSGKNACVLIGPEGDFSTDEVDLAINAGFKKISLGSSRLRTETAGIVACHTLQLLNEA